jgi:hypothetical protein
MVNLTATEELSYDLAILCGLICEDSRICDKCNGIMKIEQGKKRHGFNKRFRCFKRTCRNQSSFWKNTIFKGNHLSITNILRLMYCFSISFGVKKTIAHLNLSPTTVIRWFKIFRRIICADYMNNVEHKIGGAGFTVEIDETHICKRKYGVGRVLLSEAVWLVGGICRETGEIFLKTTTRRNSNTLSNIILNNVNSGTTIITDCWRGYSGLSDLNFNHFTVNHSINFVSPDNNEIHTQNVERLWRSIKAVIKKFSGIYRKSLLIKFLWDKNVGNVDELQKFNLFSSLVARYYNNN